MMDFSQWAGMTIAILTILVTILIGWQIFNAIEIKGMLKEIRILSNQCHKQETLLSKQKHYTNGYIKLSHAQTIRHSASDLTDYREAYRQYAEALVEFLEASPEPLVDSCISGMERCQQHENGIAFKYSDDYDKGFVKACDDIFEKIEMNYNILSKSQRDKIKNLNKSRLKYSNN